MTLGSDTEEQVSRGNKKCEGAPQPSTSGVKSVTKNDTDEEVARVNKPQEAVPQSSTSTIEDETIADEILREARINSLNLVFTKKTTVPAEIHEPEPQRPAVFSGTEQSWLNITKGEGQPPQN